MLLVAIASAAAGGAAVWFGKDWMMKFFIGAVAFEKSLEAKIAALKAKI
jgi:hypothetical protein